MNEFLKNNKHVPAFTAALAITLMVGLTLLAIGVEAVFNSRLDSAQAAGSETAEVDALQIQDTQQLQDLVIQYQNREQQYQVELQKAAEQINQAEAASQQSQAVLQELQNAGVITIGPDGQVTVASGFAPGGSGTSAPGFFDAGHDEHEEHEEHDEHDD